VRADRDSSALDLLRQTPRRVEELLRGVPRPALVWVPAPGKWSVLEVLCHLRDFEKEVYHEAYRCVAAGERPEVPAPDAETRALRGRYRDERPSEALRAWKRERREVLGLLESLDESAWERHAVHAVAGPVALASLVDMHAQHDRTHAAQIETILERRSILDRLEAARREVRERIEALAPQGGAWSGNAEAARSESGRRLAFEPRMLSRYVRILAVERPPLRPLDADPIEPPPGRAAMPAAVRQFERLRGATLELLHALGPQLWRRRGVHPRRGDLTIAELVTQHLDHDAERLNALRALANPRASATLVAPGDPAARPGASI
jgi:hypothetical protein